MRRLVWLSSKLGHDFRAAACANAPLETGGMLVGYWASASEVVVTRSIAAGPNACHRPRSFAPDHDFQVNELSRIYKETGGVETYLGDWHSHPGQERPVMSNKDRATLRRIASSAEGRAPIALMLIVGGSGRNWTPRVWAGCVDTLFRFLGRLVVEECELRVS